MGQTVAVWIGDNFEEVRNLTRRGIFPPSFMRKFEMYNHYTGLNHKSKMLKYQITADTMRVSLTVVRDAIKQMERTI